MSKNPTKAERVAAKKYRKQLELIAQGKKPSAHVLPAQTDSDARREQFEHDKHWDDDSQLSDQRTADHIDGYDRDDLGESPNY